MLERRRAGRAIGALTVTALVHVAAIALLSRSTSPRAPDGGSSMRSEAPVVVASVLPGAAPTFEPSVSRPAPESALRDPQGRAADVHEPSTTSGERPSEPSAAKEVARASAGTYWPTKALDFPPLPRSAPDSSGVSGLGIPGSAIRLQLYIDARGVVTDVRILEARNVEGRVIAEVKRMFYATGFVAGRRGGIDVASYMTIEMDLSESS